MLTTLCAKLVTGEWVIGRQHPTTGAVRDVCQIVHHFAPNGQLAKATLIPWVPEAPKTEFQVQDWKRFVLFNMPPDPVTEKHYLQLVSGIQLVAG